MNIGLGHGQLRNGPLWLSKLLFTEPVVYEMLGAVYGLIKELHVEGFVLY